MNNDNSNILKKNPKNIDGNSKEFNFKDHES